MRLSGKRYEAFESIRQENGLVQLTNRTSKVTEKIRPIVQRGLPNPFQAAGFHEITKTAWRFAPRKRALSTDVREEHDGHLIGLNRVAS